MRKILSVLLLLLTATGLINSQQIADTTFGPVLTNPEYASGKGPVVILDEGHNNFHTSEGRYLPFSRLLRADGYIVKGYKGTYETGVPAETKVLVIANALNKINTEKWYLPTPSAFTKKEIESIRLWVNKGGALFLIADHMPMGGAAKDLAAAFGFTFTNGFAADTSKPGPAIFTRQDGTLIPSEITNGRNDSEKISQVATFTGQAFKAPEAATPIIKFDKKYLLLESDTAWVFDKTTIYTKIDGWLQGAYMKYGNGKIVFFGEAAMFTSQLAGPNRVAVGMTSPYALENQKLLLNILHWLD
jgi:hypothetical protein